MRNQWKAFVEEYLKEFNATKAAILAGYSKKTAYSMGSRLLKNVEIAGAIRERLDELHMSADEALKLLSAQARGDLGEFMDISSVGFNLNLKDAKERGLTPLVKKIKQKTTIHIAKKESDEDREVTETEIELYDAQAAIDKILRVAGKYKDNLNVNVRSYTVELDDDS